jgi:hypothetical protein
LPFWPLSPELRSRFDLCIQVRGRCLARLRLLAGGLVGVDVASTRPGVVHAGGVDLEPALGRIVAARMKAVPRTSVICSTGSRAARRCAISTSARSALPYSSRSHLASTTMLRRTLSLQ